MNFDGADVPASGDGVSNIEILMDVPNGSAEFTACEQTSRISREAEASHPDLSGRANTAGLARGRRDAIRQTCPSGCVVRESAPAFVVNRSWPPDRRVLLQRSDEMTTWILNDVVRCVECGSDRVHS